MYSLGASWSVYILIVSLYHFSPPLMQLLTITSFILLNLFEGLVYPQAALLPSFVYSYIAPLTRTLPRGPCTLYIICAALFGAVFTSFCLLKNEVMNLPSS